MFRWPSAVAANSRVFRFPDITGDGKAEIAWVVGDKIEIYDVFGSIPTSVDINVTAALRPELIVEGGYGRFSPILPGRYQVRIYDVMGRLLRQTDGDGWTLYNNGFSLEGLSGSVFIQLESGPSTTLGHQNIKQVYALYLMEVR